MGIPWDQPGADLARDIREFMEQARQQYLSLFSVPSHGMGPAPEPVSCPACGRERRQCLLLFSGDPVHEQERRKAYMRRAEEAAGG